jgi:hypothetical protein
MIQSAHSHDENIFYHARRKLLARLCGGAMRVPLNGNRALKGTGNVIIAD